MVLKKSTTIKTETFEKKIRNAKALVMLEDSITKERALEILNVLEKQCYEWVPESELELFRLPKGMTMRG